MAYRSSSSANGASGTHPTGTAPSGLAAGDRLYVFVQGDVTAATITPPSPWVSIGKMSQTVLDAQTVEVFEIKSSDGTESYAFTILPLQGAWIVQVVAFTGRHTTEAATISSTNSDTGNTTPVTIGLTGVTATASADLLFLCGLDQSEADGVWSFSTVTNFTERQDVSTGVWNTAGLQTRDNVSAGATGTLTTTATRTSGTGTAGWQGFVISIPSAPFKPGITIF